MATRRMLGRRLRRCRRMWMLWRYVTRRKLRNTKLRTADGWDCAATGRILTRLCCSSTAILCTTVIRWRLWRTLVWRRWRLRHSVVRLNELTFVDKHATKQKLEVKTGDAAMRPYSFFADWLAVASFRSWAVLCTFCFGIRRLPFANHHGNSTKNRQRCKNQTHSDLLA